MTQLLPTLIPELPDPFNGDDLADDWNEFIAAYQTGQLGATRPVWAAKGFLWAKDNGDGTVTWMGYDGANDTELNPAVVRFLNIDVTNSTNNYSRAGSQSTDGFLSDQANITRSSATSKLRIRATTYGYVELTGADDNPWGWAYLQWHDSVDYTPLTTLRNLGALNISIGAGVQRRFIIHVAEAILTDAHVRSDNGNWGVRLFGRSTTDALINMYGTTFSYEEYEDA